MEVMILWCKNTEPMTVKKLLIKPYFFSLILCLLLSPIANAKPGAGLFVTLNWINGPVLGQVNTFQVNVTAGIPASDLKLEIILPKGAELVAGEQVSTLKSEPGIPRQIEYRVLLSQEVSEDINAKVSTGQKGQAYFSAIGTLPVKVSDSQSLKPRKNDTPNYKRIERNGVTIREYRLK